MTWTTPQLLFALLLAPLPWLLAWLRRPTPLPQPWGAMPILETALRKTRFRRRFDDLLLLCVRTLLIVFLVLALAGPVLQWRHPLPSSAAATLVQAVPRPRILIVDGSSSAPASDRACADYVALALEDREPQRLDATAWFDDGSADISSADPDRLPGDLERFDVIVLCDLAFPNRRESEILHAFSASGRGLVLIFGERTNPGAWNAGFFHGPVLKDFRDVKQDADTIGPLDPLEYRHPVVAPFRDHPHAGLTALPVDRYVPMNTRSTAKTPEASRRFGPWEPVLLFPNGDPLITAGTGPAGRLLVWTTAPQPTMSRIAVRPAFVPLIRETVFFAAQRVVPDGENFSTPAASATSAVPLGPWLFLAACLIFAAETFLQYSARRTREMPVA